jgi:hypothetical protein
MIMTKIPATAQIILPEQVTMNKLSVNRTFLTAIGIDMV